jgi:ketosteroid isomerase-like protein
MMGPMHPNARLLHGFYQALDDHDAERMVACYAPDVTFSDPVFPHLRGDEARAMWRMLCARGKDLRVLASRVEADDTRGSAHWDADYTFSATGRAVHNRIEARFTFRDGAIVRHADDFDLWRWAGMALGPKGRLLGWLPPLQATVRRQADASLRSFMRRPSVGPVAPGPTRP